MPKRLEERREGLIALIERYQPQGSWRNSVTIVFDGKSDVYAPLRHSKVRIIFTLDETADEKIKRLVQQSPSRKSIVVVSDDRDIKYHIRALGATPMSVRDFLSKISEPKPAAMAARIKGQAPADTKRISKTLEQKITSELVEIWLGKDKLA